MAPCGAPPSHGTAGPAQPVAGGRLLPAGSAQPGVAQQRIQIADQRVVLVWIPVSRQPGARLVGGRGRGEDDVQQAEGATGSQDPRQIGVGDSSLVWGYLVEGEAGGGGIECGAGVADGCEAARGAGKVGVLRRATRQHFRRGIDAPDVGTAHGQQRGVDAGADPDIQYRGSRVAAVARLMS